MASTKQITALAAEHGFEHFETPGFLGFTRVHPDGRTQKMLVFTWSNRKHAIKDGIPASYLVICPALNASPDLRREEDTRIRLPLVEWPSEEMPSRKWAEVATEFTEILAPIFDLPDAEGSSAIAALPERYVLV